MRGSIFAEESGEGSASHDARRGTDSVFRHPEDAESTDDVDRDDEPVADDEVADDHESASDDEPGSVDEAADGRERGESRVETMTVFSDGEVYELGVDE